MSDIENLMKKQRKFAQERNWESYHNPKNLSMALSVEASELVEIFQWLTPEQALLKGDPKRKQASYQLWK